MSKMNLTEATMLALQGKLNLTESVEVEIEDDATVIKTDDATVVVAEPEVEVEIEEDNEETEEVPVESEEVVEVPVESEEVIIPEEEVPVETFEEEPAVLVDETEEVDESKEVKTEDVNTEKPTAECSDEDILNYIVNNFNTITGVEVESIFNRDLDNQDIFNQAVIDTTSGSILEFLDSIGVEGKRLDDILYKLDDELALLNESKAIKKEYFDKPEDEFDFVIIPGKTTAREIDDFLEECGLENQYTGRELLNKAKVKTGLIAMESSDGQITLHSKAIKKESIEQEYPARPYQAKIEDAIEEGLLDAKEVASAVMGWVADDELDKIIRANDWMFLLEEGVISTLRQKYLADRIGKAQAEAMSGEEGSDEGSKQYKKDFKKIHNLAKKEQEKELAKARKNNEKAYKYSKKADEYVAKANAASTKVDDLINKATDKYLDAKEESKDEKCKDCDGLNCTCKKESIFDAKSFNKHITDLLKTENNRIKSFKSEKILRNQNTLKIEGKILNSLGKTVDTTLVMKKVQEGVKFQRYVLSNTNGLLKENKQNNIYMMTYTNKDNIFECRYITK